MKIEQLDVKRAELVVGAVLVAIAVLVIAEATRMGAGWGPSGPQPGFFPRLSALLMAIGAIVAMTQAVRQRSSRPLYRSGDQCREVLKVGGPIVAAVCALSFFGFYLVTALYMGLFALWYGRYRWYVALVAAIVLPLVLFFTFERGFKISLPKSAWYGSLTPF